MSNENKIEKYHVHARIEILPWSLGKYSTKATQRYIGFIVTTRTAYSAKVALASLLFTTAGALT
jgi:hypothetical protein